MNKLDIRKLYYLTSFELNRFLCFPFRRIVDKKFNDISVKCSFVLKKVVFQTQNLLKTRIVHQKMPFFLHFHDNFIYLQIEEFD